MNRTIALFLALLSIAVTASTEGKSSKKTRQEVTIAVSDVIPFSESASGEIGLTSPRGFARDQIEDKCGLGRALSEAVVDAARRKGIRVVPTAEIEKAQGRVLLIVIEGARGELGGALSGTKSLTVRGELRDGDNVLGSFVARRQQTALTAGTCRSLVHCARDIAKDIGKWLKRPVLKGHLGSA